ncbi:MAG: P44/Msp2 family outer membrane protein [Wolbachia endosymbiont of Fragariocoptes setiger]|nr:P44/Msp2 family outer membrane protein [Wolbachia endosymbiont of Fragariocoptes setiger]
MRIISGKDRFSFSPYVGAGIGVTRTEIFEKESIGLGYQLKAGVNYRMTEDTDMFMLGIGTLE